MIRVSTILRAVAGFLLGCGVTVAAGGVVADAAGLVAGGVGSVAVGAGALVCASRRRAVLAAALLLTAQACAPGTYSVRAGFMGANVAVEWEVAERAEKNAEDGAGSVGGDVER